MTATPFPGLAPGSDAARLRHAVENLPTGNAPPILSEILEALGQLIENGTPTVIDIGAIPFTGGDEKAMQDILGDGEVTAVLSAMGDSHIAETGIPGVWRVDHYDPDGAVQSRFIEVTFIPEILKTQPEDATRGHEMLAERLRERLGTSKPVEDNVNAE